MMEIPDKNRIIFVLTETIDDNELLKLERKLETTEYDFEKGMVVRMEYIDMIYRKLTGILSQEELWFYLYDLKWVSTLRIYDKIGKINRMLNRGKNNKE